MKGMQTGAFPLPRGLSGGNHRRGMVREGEGRGPWPKKRETRLLTLTGTIEGGGWCTVGPGGGCSAQPSFRIVPPPHSPAYHPRSHQSRLNGTKADAKTKTNQVWRTLLCMTSDVFLGLAELV